MIVMTLAALLAAADPVTEARFDRWMDAVTPSTLVVGEDDGAMTLEAMLDARDVPGVQVVLIDDWKVVASRAYGLADVASGRAVTTDTRFQAASISKPVAAMAMLAMVEDGALTLDGDVNDKLTSWKVPAPDFDGVVTLAGLLSHTAGTSVSGFPGYAQGDTLPTLPQLLDGKGNTDPVRVTTAPGAEHRYSGGGFTIAELMAEDVAGMPFEYIAYREVLAPLGMTRSSYALGGDIGGPLAFAYDGGGTLVKGNFHNYPEQAAAGLWTTAEDLATFALALGRAANGETGLPLTPETARLMLTEVQQGYGLGIGTWEESGARYFGHGGSNRGYKTMLRFLPERGEGIVVMTNGDRGAGVFQSIIGTVANEMGWEGMGPRRLVRASLAPDALAAIAGTYVFGGQDYVLQVEGDRWRLTDPEGDTEIALPIEGDKVWFPEAEQLFEVERADDGSVAAITMGGARLPRTGGPKTD